MGLGQLKFSVPLLPRHEVRFLIQRMQLLIWKRVQLNVQLMMTILERFVKSFFIFKHHSSCYIWWKKTKATCIICRKESKVFGPFKSRYTRHSIAANMSLVVKKCIFMGKNMYRITQCKLKKKLFLTHAVRTMTGVAVSFFIIWLHAGCITHT